MTSLHHLNVMFLIYFAKTTVYIQPYVYMYIKWFKNVIIFVLLHFL